MNFKPPSPRALRRFSLRLPNGAPWEGAPQFCEGGAKRLEAFAPVVRGACKEFGLPIRGHGYQSVTIELNFMDPVFAAWRRGISVASCGATNLAGRHPFPRGAALRAVRAPRTLFLSAFTASTASAVDFLREPDLLQLLPDPRAMPSIPRPLTTLF